MTTNIELEKKLKCFKEFIGVFPRDKLPKIKSYPVSIIINTDMSKGSGEHWVAIHINSKKFGIYFDSYGFPPLAKEMIKFLDEYCKNGWLFNQTMIQGVTSINCGQFCVLFLFLRSIGVSLHQFNKLFSRSHDVNDLIVEKLYKEFKIPC